ncbi:putative PEP-CTERM sorting domain-containing protein [Rubrivivax sp. A210]|uniref:FxDxF family PEP-CTERM protein n=1 Tax=Rubrivivax sp. A210 TaxID=2772301 RepID=UPI0019199E5F|nr:FxDxF family PEP-CTERM protein [Rubrivivax sp. A210]CAD5372001.1 putative PEP-CTERM sorting domain-containing protein [Rubrivivax sp. A210]
MKFISVLAGLSLALASAGAAAASYSFQAPLAPDLPMLDAQMVSGPSFVDQWDFQAPASAVLVTGGVDTITMPGLNIDNIRIELYTAANQFIAGGAAGEFSQVTDVAVTPGASYYFRVSGDVVGEPNGFYTFMAISAPVPEPGGLALALAGAVVLAGLARRRLT